MYGILPNIKEVMCNSVSSKPFFVKWKEQKIIIVLLHKETTQSKKTNKIGYLYGGYLGKHGTEVGKPVPSFPCNAFT